MDTVTNADSGRWPRLMADLETGRDEPEPHQLVTSQPVALPDFDPYRCSHQDLLVLARRMRAVAHGCDVLAPPTGPNNPWTAIGQLRALTTELERSITERLERDRQDELLRERMRMERQRRLEKESFWEPPYRSWDEIAADAAGKPCRGEI